MTNERKLRIESSCTELRRFTLGVWLAGVLLLVSPRGFAQAQLPGQAPPDVNLPAQDGEPGIDVLGYHVQQSVELGYRSTDTEGNAAMYDTFVNLQSGPRLLNQSLSMRSLESAGVPFDQFNLNSFGWGGDPNTVARLSMSKNRWYNFDFSYRHDQNFWDYNLFANPLNPPTSTPNVPVQFSPHEYQSRRNMYDYSLLLLPQSRFHVRFDYNRVNDFGPSLSTLHIGTEGLLLQPLDVITDMFDVGVDYKIAKQTTISFDENFERQTNQTDSSLDPFFSVPLANGTPVSFGVSVNAPAGSAPCATPILATGYANPTCNGYLSYSLTQNQHTDIPQEQVRFQSRSLKNLDITARYAYSHAHESVPSNEFFSGRESRTNLQQYTVDGFNLNTWNTNTAEISATYYITPNLRLLDSFRFYNYGIPSTFNSLETNLFAVNLLTAVPTAPGTSTHTTSSEADIAPYQYSWFLGQDSKRNVVQMEWDITKHFGGRIGFDYTHRIEDNHFANFAVAGPNGTGELFYPTNPLRGDCAGGTLNPDGTCTFLGQFDGEDDLFTINQYTGLVGLWARPTQALRINFDANMSSLGSTLTSASGGFSDVQSLLTRTTPTNQQQYRLRASYIPRPWLNLTGSINILEQRNTIPEIAYRGHNRNYAVTALLAPKASFGLDLSYNYDDYLQDANICFSESPASAVPAGTVSCLGDPTLLQNYGTYVNHNQFGSATVMLKPMKRLTTNIGYSIINVSGNTLTLNPLQPLGPLAYNYYQPTANFAVVLTKNLTWNAAWNYYDYGETASYLGPLQPRNFHANLATVSVRAAF